MATKKTSVKKRTTKKTPPKKKTEAKAFPVKAPRGTRDILPPEQKYWEYVTETAKAVMRGFGFQRLDTPIFEETILFERGLGDETDIVSKEMFDLKSRGSSAKYSLRPEGTAPVLRSYIEHGMRSWPKPVKLFYIGPFFRYERPQAGRWRQLHQFGVEVLGSAAAVTDAHVIYLLDSIFKELNLEDYTVHINSIGQPSERKEYIKLLKDHYRRNRSKMSQWAKDRLQTNPLRVLDSKEEKDIQLANTAPRLIDHLSEPSKQHFEEVLSLLDELEVSYEVTPSLVRGLDYYTDTVFEFIPKAREDVAQGSMAAGGRYNGLMKLLGGRETPGIGFGAGIERIIDQVKEEGIELTASDTPHLFVAHLGEQAKHHALKLLRELQQANIPFAESLDRDGMQAQLGLADRLKVPWVLIIGHKEVMDKTVILRSMESGMQEVIPQAEMISELRRRLNIPEVA